MFKISAKVSNKNTIIDERCHLADILWEERWITAYACSSWESSSISKMNYLSSQGLAMILTSQIGTPGQHT